jgi:hypothetical protein
LLKSYEFGTYGKVNMKNNFMLALPKERQWHVEEYGQIQVVMVKEENIIAECSVPAQMRNKSISR